MKARLRLAIVAWTIRQKLQILTTSKLLLTTSTLLLTTSTLLLTTSTLLLTRSTLFLTTSTLLLKGIEQVKIFATAQTMANARLIINA